MVRQRAENAACKNVSVDFLTVEDRVSECSTKLCGNGRITEQFVTDPISIDDFNSTMIRQATSDRAFPGPDTSDEADDQWLFPLGHALREW